MSQFILILFYRVINKMGYGFKIFKSIQYIVILILKKYYLIFFI